MVTKLLRKYYNQIREERRAAPAIRIGYYFKTQQSKPTNKIHEEVGIIADHGTTALNMKSDIHKLAICIGANACEVFNMDIELSRRIRHLQFWQRIQWLLISMLIGAVGMIIYLSHQ